MENIKTTDALNQKITNLTDEKLYKLCKKYGSTALLWRQKFIGLLPEVNRRRLYEKKGFSTILDFAFKLCGLSIDQVRLALNLKNRFKGMPILEKMLEEGEVSINKLARIVSIATPENEEELAEKVRILPKSALETLVRDEKFAMKNDVKIGGLFGEEISINAANLFGEIENQNGLDKPLFEAKSLPGQTLKTAKRSLIFNSDSCADTGGLSFQLADDVKKELEELHSKGINVNEFLRKTLKQRREEIEKRKEKIAREIQDEQKKGNDARGERGTSESKSKSASRYIPAKIKKVLKEEHGTKCSIPTCQKPAEVIHHTQTFGLSHTHDPRFMAPLCKEHHMIAHSMDIKYHEIRRTCSA